MSKYHRDPSKALTVRGLIQLLEKYNPNLTIIFEELPLTDNSKQFLIRQVLTSHHKASPISHAELRLGIEEFDY